MGSLLFWLQQFSLPFVELWPLWVLFLVLGLICRRYFRGRGFLWWKIGCSVVIGMLLLVRVVIVVSYPYKEMTTTISMKDNETLPMRIFYRNGNLRLEGSPDDNLHYVGTELSGAYIFARGKYNANANDHSETTEGLLLKEGREPSLFTGWASQGRIQIPEKFSQSVQATFQHATGYISFDQTNVTDIHIEVLESMLTVRIPNEKKTIKLYIEGINSHIYLEVPQSAEVRLNKAFQEFSRPPAEFEQTGPLTWLRKGNGDGPVIIFEDVIAENALEIKYIN